MSDYEDNIEQGYMPPPEPHLFTSSIYYHAHDMRASDQCHLCGERRDNPVHVVRWSEPEDGG